MSDLNWECLDSTTALRDVTPEWDDLWLRSAATLPTGRAPLVADWIEQFEPRARVRAIVVRQAGQMVAALPLLAAGPKGLGCGRLPGNAWSPAGELLLDPLADASAACDQLVSALRGLHLPIVWFDGIPTETLAWRLFSAALARHGMSTTVRERFRVEQVEIAGSWERYFAGRSRSLRRQVRRALVKAEQSGTLKLRILDRLMPDEIEAWFRRGLQIEDRGWKGAAGSSVLRAPGLLDFYLRQARQLARWGQLKLVFLEHQGEPIAFEYGWSSKGVYFSPKVAYDEAFGQFSPGQLLRAVLLEKLHTDGPCELVDYLGPTSRATADWSTRSYPVSRVMIATSLTGRMAAGAYELARSAGKRLRSRPIPPTPCDAKAGCETEPPLADLLAEPAHV